MKVFVMILIMAGLAGCDNSSEVKAELDSAKTKIDTALNSPTMDSIKAKGKRIVDTIGSKGGRLLEKAEDEFNDLKKKDSSKSNN